MFFKEWSRIDPELKSSALLAKLLFHHSRNYFKLRVAMEARSKTEIPSWLGVEEVLIPSLEGDHSIRTPIYRPHKLPENAPIVLYLHGGGYALGTPERFLFAMAALMKVRPAIFVAPAYRRSLDAPYPAAIDDCYDALLWVKQNAERIGGRSDQIIVAGHSAGGGLTAAVSLRARDRGDVNIAYQFPIYPMIDDRMSLPSAVGNTAPVWNSKANKLGWDLYLKDLLVKGDEIPYDAAPARATDYSGLPPTATFIGDLDPFLDETREYVENLRAAGVSAKYAEFQGGFHGFELIKPKSKIGSDANSFLFDCFSDAVDNYFAEQP